MGLLGGWDFWVVGLLRGGRTSEGVGFLKGVGFLGCGTHGCAGTSGEGGFWVGGLLGGGTSSHHNLRSPPAPLLLLTSPQQWPSFHAIFMSTSV